MRPEIDPRVDFVFKRLFASDSSRPILSDLLNAVLEFPPGLLIRDLTLLNPISEKEFEQDKQTIFDVRASDQGNRHFLLEMQRSVSWYFAKRTLYNWAVAFAEQLQQGEHHVTLQPTFVICVLDDNLFDNEHFHHRFRMVDVEQGTLLCKDAEIHTIELKKFSLEVEEVKTPLQRWCYFLKHGEELDAAELPATLDVPGIRQAMEVLMRISESELDRQKYISRRLAERDAATREYVSKHSREIGLAEGRQEGIQQGIQEGRQEGRQEGEIIGKIHFAQRLLKQPLTPREELLKLSLEEMARRAEQLEREALGETESS